MSPGVYEHFNHSEEVKVMKKNYDITIISYLVDTKTVFKMTQRSLERAQELSPVPLRKSGRNKKLL